MDLFTAEQIKEFKDQATDYKWMGDCIITPELISFTDLMYHKHWRILPSPSDREYLTLHQEYRSGDFHQCNSDCNMTRLLMRLNDKLWAWDRVNSGADLSRYDEMDIMMHRFIAQQSAMSLYLF